MNERTLFLGWQDSDQRQWFPVGRLDADMARPNYRFRYVGGARRAEEEAGFPTFYEFPDMYGDYHSPELFALFRNRVIASGRADRKRYLRNLALPEHADPIEILSVNGGQRITDPYEVFPKLEKHHDGSFACRFLLHGWRHLGPSIKTRIESLEEQEELRVILEENNPKTGLAVQIQTMDGKAIGWAPRYLTKDLAAAVNASSPYSAYVVRIAPLSEPSKQPVLIEMRGFWKEYEPMADEDFIPLVE